MTLVRRLCTRRRLLPGEKPLPVGGSAVSPIKPETTPAALELTEPGSLTERRPD